MNVNRFEKEDETGYPSVRKAKIVRQTGETSVELELCLDGQGQAQLDIPVPFLSHMLHLFAVHSGCDLTIQASGDIEVDDHHLVEDIGICLGRALYESLGDKVGIRRYGQRYTPMDEALARTVLDFSGRSAFVWQAEFRQDKIGQFSTELVEEFFKSVANEARMALHMAVLYGSNHHHMVEALFKSFAAALREAVTLEHHQRLLSSKGVLE
ncbi:MULTISPECIES: imidazoleglycerol-phosphate dehydratase HisB [Alicyclobacillus]|uniref:Imidazoleglycerol-phosphate dehydratase n=1 Tax=Alicyclobacillus tolerans TaxID=90970 RepID=A0ABT9LTP5_9BACL|nr:MULTISPECIES: imidazoleglycerol-phosphate dehydratase HisB [Alicyclobacillus]MDP9727640.1 imidazoleglycerol-phosphate dehydratase [Alicyclobacillus tengchongensis]